MSGTNPAAAAAESKVAAPGTVLALTGVVMALMGVFTMLNALFGFADGVMASYTTDQQMDAALSGTTGALLGAMNFVCSLLVAAAGWRMRHLESHLLCTIGALMAVVPCFTGCGCCLLSVPVGIWALVVLNDAAVKAEFH